MIITGITALAAAKWLVVGKIMTAVGTGLLTIAPAVEKIKRERE